MLNSIVLQGRLTRDPSIRQFEDGTKVANFSVAVERNYKTQTGERLTDFIDCTARRAKAEFIEKYFRKGSMILVKGELQIRDWTDKDGNKRKSAEVVVDDAFFAASKREEGGAPAGPSYQDPTPAGVDEGPEDSNEDYPF